jgi:hypothetical protein
MIEVTNSQDRNYKFTSGEDHVGDEIFKHTFVDVPDQEEQEGKAESILSGPKPKPQKDIFLFQNFKFDLPNEYYKQLGNFECVN